MANDDIKKYGNKKELDIQSSTGRAERISKKDKNVLSQPTHRSIKFGEFNENKVDDQFIELHVYDENGIQIESIYSKNKINWTIQKARGDATTGNQLVFKPGTDLRNLGYEFGSFKVIYNVFEELLGKRDKNQVYIQEISPSRKEIRILPTTIYPKATEDKSTKPFIGSKGYPSLQNKQDSFKAQHVYSEDQWELQEKWKME
jgi:hypothetical protein